MAEENKDAAAPKASAKKSKAGGEKTVGKFTHGDHMVHLLIQKGKKFISTCEDDRVLNLIIETELDGVKQYSSPKDEVLVNDDSLIVWNESLFFEMKNLTPQKAKDLVLHIRILNRGWLKNELVGQAHMDLSSIYFSENRKVEHTWVALDNPDAEDFENMKGLLKVSANVTGPKDNAQKLEASVGPEPDKMKMYMSPSIKRTFYQLTISIIEGQNLPVFGTTLGFGEASLEAYFKCQYGGGTAMKTDVHNQIKKKIGVNQHFQLPVQTPVLSDRLVIEVWDYNSIASDTHLGSLIMSAKQLIAEGSREGGFYIWKNLYGSPQDNDNEVADAMNLNPDMASDWKGMVLLHIHAEENDKPKKLMEAMDPEIKKRAKEEGWFEPEDYEMIVEVGQGITLPEADVDYKVQVSIQNHDFKTEVPKEKKGEYVRWSCRSKDKAENSQSEAIRVTIPKNEFSIFTSDESKLVNFVNEYRVYIYLLDESDKPICYWHGLLSEFREHNAQWRWIQLKPDRSYEVIEDDHKAGMISVKLSIARLKSNNGGSIPWKQELAWKKPPPRRIGAYQLRCNIFQCKDLPAADSDGSSDPFIKIFNVSGQDVATSVIEDNVNPIFMECKEVGLDFMDFHNFTDAPPIVFDIMDADEGYFSDSADFLGRCIIKLKDVKNLGDGESDIAIPEWYDIKFGTDENSPACGQVLCSFSLFPGDAPNIPLDVIPRKMNEMVEKLDYDVFINCLGLREVESIGLIPIQKAFVSFMVKSLTDPKTSGQMQNIKTLPAESGSNPNINSVVKFNIPLPTDELYCPALSCTVYDQVFLGFSQPIVGTFTIPLGEIMTEQKKDRKDTLREAKKILSVLTQMIQGVDPEQVDISGVNIEIANNAGGETQQQLLLDDDDMSFEEVPDEDQVFLETQEGADEPKTGKKKSKMGVKKDSKAIEREQVKQAAEDKKREKEARQKEARDLMKTVDNSNNVSIPNYIYDKQLRVYREVLPPNNKLFKSVGFNDQELIKEIMGLMNKIPSSAAQTPELARSNTMLASKMRKEMKKGVKNKLKQASENAEDSQPFDAALKKVDDAELTEAVNLMQQVYDKTNKHYRRFYEDELENDPEIFAKPVFFNENIKRGQSRGVEKSWLSFGASNQDESGQESTIRNVGRFKGVVDIVNTEIRQKYDAKKELLLQNIFESLGTLYKQKTGNVATYSLESVETAEDKATFLADCEKMGIKMPTLTDFLEKMAFSGLIKELLTRSTDAIAHLYLIQGYGFASRDIGSASDPYLIVTCGETEFNDRENYQDDQPDPKFNKRLDFNISFPGAPPLVIEAYDYDLLFGDDLIGKTTIDLDDRFFNPKWQAIDEKPIETRELYHQSSAMNQGVIDMWVDIDPVKKTSDVGKVWEICSEPENMFEVRLAVFKCTDVPMEDWEGTTDAYIKAFISDADKQETDTHYRCTTGTPSYNYRLLFNVQTPQKTQSVLTLQCWDRDLLKSNDLTCQWNLDITEVIRDAKITKGPIHLTKTYYESSLKPRIAKEGEPEPLAFVKKKSNGDPGSTIQLISYSPTDKEKKKPISIYFDLRVVPASYAEMNKVGAARADPNNEPTLPPPVGRFELSLNPFKMLNQMCGAALRRKIWCCICCVLCLVVCYYVFPLLASFVTLFGGD